jgi:beta-mannosidase
MQDLGGAWDLQQAGPGAKPGRAWAPATVPGNVHTDLMALGRLKDPLLRGQEAEAGWVEQCDWWYRRRFTPDAALLTLPQLRLVAEGIDTWATLWLNGRRLGRVEDMFVEHCFDVRGLLKPGVNELLLRFEAPGRVLQALEKRYGPRAAVGDPLRVHGRKAQYSFGWDWGPRLPTCGIFKPIRLEGAGEARIDDLWCRTLKAAAAEASGLLIAEVNCTRPQRLALRADLGPWHFERTVALKKGLNRLRLPWTVAKPRLWWPRGHGAPELYQAELSLGPAARAAVTVGLRTVALRRVKDAAGESFGFTVNGRAIYAKGANWIPADSFLGRVSDARIQGLVDQAAAANMTLLRVWGGGLYEGEAFYGACDRAGLLVWQDFPFACSEVSEHPAFMAQVEAEAALALRRLRRHPSLALWCGNNEAHMARDAGWFKGRDHAQWGRQLYEDRLPKLCARLDPERPYWPGSPFGGPDANSATQGDRHHWEVWASYRAYDEYRLDRGRFITEFGFAALPNAGRLREALAPQDRWVQSRGLAMHDKVEWGGASARLSYYINKELPLAGGLEAFRYLSQVNQALALRAGFEHWRRLKPHNQGALVWQLNDCWPVISWSLLDSADEPKLAYHAVRRALDDVLLSAVEADPRRMTDKVGRLPLRGAQEDGQAQAWLTLDGPRGLKGRLTVERWGMRGREAVLARLPVSVGAQASRCVWRHGRRDSGVLDPSTQYLAFHLVSDRGPRRSLLFFEPPKRLELPLSSVTLGARPQGDGVELAVQARHLALALEIQAPVPGRFSDNGFDLLPGETRRLSFIPQRPGPIRGAWTLYTLNQAQAEARRA